jgi:ribosome-binding factor A
MNGDLQKRIPVIRKPHLLRSIVTNSDIHPVPSKSFHRTDRVSAQLRRELGTIVHETVREHGLPSVSVSDVEVTRDLAHAKVFVTALQEERSTEAVKALKELAPQMRYQLGKAMKLRHVPELHFHYDDSVDRGERIGNLLRDNPPLGEE